MSNRYVLDAFKTTVGQLQIRRLLWAALVLMFAGSARPTSTALAQEAASPVATLTEVERAAKLEQRDQFGRAARAAHARGDLPTAIKAAEDMLAIELGLFGDDHKDVIGSLELLAECHEASADLTAAKRIRTDLVSRVLRVYGQNDHRVADATFAVKHLATLAALTAEQRKELSEAAAAGARVVQLREQGQFAAAAKLAESVLDTHRRLLGEDHPYTATRVNDLGEAYHSQGNYTVAEQLYQRALKINEKSFGPDHPTTTARSLNNLAALYYSQGNYAAAEPLYQRAVKIREKSLGPDHPHTAAILNNLAALYESQGNYAAAEPLYQRALEIREKVRGPDHPDTANSLNNLAGLYQAQGNYAAGEPLYQRALKINEKSLGPDHPETATSLSELAGLYKSQGKYGTAEPLYQRAVKIREKSLGPDHPDTATSLNNLAGLYKAQGNYAAAEPLYQRALKIRERALGPDHPDTAQSLNELAVLYYSQGNYAAAETLYQRALKIRERALGPDHPGTATSLNNLAALYKSQGNYSAAEPLFQRALKIKEKSPGPDHPDTATSLNNLALLYAAQRNHAAAEPLYQRALKIWGNSHGIDRPNFAKCLNNLALLYESQGNYAAAEPLYQRALKIREEVLGPDHPDTASGLSNLAFLQWEYDQVELAAPRARRALGVKLRHLDETAAIQTEQQQFLMARDVGGDVNFWLTVSAPDARWTDAVYRDVLAWKGLITARQQGLRLALKDDPLFAEFRQVTQQLSTVSLSPPLPPSDPQALAAWRQREAELRQSWENQKGTLETEHQRLEQELAVKSVPFRESLEQRRVQPADLVATLKAQSQPTALVDVLEYRFFGRKSRDEKDERRIVAFVIRGDQPVARVELGAAHAIAQQIAIWRGRREQSDGTVTQGSPGTGPEAVAAGNWLRKHLWEPLLPQLQGIETVLISPDGALAQLPWGALPGEKPGSYLIEERALAVIPVPQMLPSLLERPHRAELPASLLLAGDIEYGGDPGQPQDLLAKRDAAGRLRDGRLLQFAKLSAAQAELSSIKDWYENADGNGTVQSLRKQKATEASFREQAPRNQWLHVITHGFFAPETVRSAWRSTAEAGDRLGELDQPRPVHGEHPGLLSGLAFAGANTPPEPGKDDGILTALEVAALDLNQVDCVVLSACETGLGEVAGGEGLLGLQRAFQVSGARTVVASLWKVPDAQTAKLMQRFYENLWDKKLGKLAALREAQIWMLHDQSARGLSDLDQDTQKNQPLPPYYWAAFVLSGDWR